MQLLVDTHALLWWLSNNPSLSRRARNAMAETSNELLVSAASAWEVATKVRLRRLPGAERLAADFLGVMLREGFGTLDITVDHAVRAGLLDSTLVVWGGEFGRTPMNEERNHSKFLGRDHHPRAFSVWLAGGGIKPGITLGQTDELGYNVAEDPIDVHDLHATILHLMGMDHTRLTYKFQGRDFRLTDVTGNVVKKLLA